MKFLLSLFAFSLFILILIPSNNIYAQTFEGEWNCLYATTDDEANGTGTRTISVGAIKENTFVALVSPAPSETVTFCYLVGYTDADSVNGRMEDVPYDPSDLITQWFSGFDAVDMRRACDLSTTADSFVYVANNDLDRNILVFKMGTTAVEPAEYRLVTGADSIWAIDVDASGRVYVTTIEAAPSTGRVLVFDGFQKEQDAWANTHTLTPLTTITVPDTGRTRGVAVNAEGSVVYVSNYDADKIYCYTGSATTGFTLNNGFDFTLEDTLTSTGGTFLDPGPWGLGFMETKNVLFVACATNFQYPQGYQYGRIYALNPNTGVILDTIDCAAWNYDHIGSWSSRPGQIGTVSGYTSPYNVDFDENFNLYTQSFFGWTVDKWQFSGEIPTIPLTITGIVRDESTIPQEFGLAQNYPNPFNPSTTIKFTLAKESNVNLKIFDLLGQEVVALINNEFMQAGSYSYKFDASTLASGTYMYRLEAGDFVQTKKMTLTK